MVRICLRIANLCHVSPLPHRGASSVQPPGVISKAVFHLVHLDLICQYYKFNQQAKHFCIIYCT